jgi:Flp pilus assembly protein TadG
LNIAGTIMCAAPPHRSYQHDRSGSVQIFFGLMATILLGFMGAAIDYANVIRIRSSLLTAADSATLATVSPSGETYLAAHANNGQDVLNRAAAATEAYFTASVQRYPGAAISNVAANVTRTNDTLNASLSFNATIQTYLLGVVGISSIDVAGTSSSSNQLLTYVDFYLLLDNSPSMGVAATPNDIATMVANTPDQCAFACHDLSGTADYYTLAHQLGVTTRIDVLRQATQQLMDTAPTVATVPNQYRTAIYTFNRSVATISNLTSNLSKARSDAASIDLVTVPYQGAYNDQYTDYNAALTSLNGIIPANGDGSPGAPQKVMFFVTDGVNDSDRGGTRSITPLDTGLCTAIKNRGVQIAVLYTTYLPLPTNAFYNKYVWPWSDQISPAMQACASPGLFFEVSPTDGIADAMQALFIRVVQQARLTQ